MCGICGEVRRLNAGHPDHHALAVVNARMAHRGPDGEGLWQGPGLAFGHRRLSIIDLTETGAQPMTSWDGTLTVTFNGEIYNYVELRQELVELGHRFRGSSDTEVLLEGWRRWGTNLPNRLNGMFAFALYDSAQEKVFFARDPMGQKPLLYRHDPNGVIFASELAALALHPAVGSTVSRDALAHYLIYEACPAPLSALDGVFKLAPGHAMLYDRTSGNLRIERYFDVVGAPVEQIVSEPGPEDFEKLHDVLMGAMRRHLRSDVPIGLYLSGGVDSSVMAVLASDVLGGGNVGTYTIRHSEASFDEADEAAATARLLGTNHHEQTLTLEGCLETVPHILQTLDEPLADPGLVAIYQVARYASNHVKVVISGDGGDEMMCGYPPFHKWALSERLAGVPLLSAGVLRPLIHALPDQFGYMGPLYKARVFARGFDQPAPVRNQAWIGSFRPDEALPVLRDGHGLAALAKSDDGFPAAHRDLVMLHQRLAGHHPLERLGYEYQSQYLANAICAHTDKANMLCSLEARAPFLDVEVVRHFNSLPVSWKWRDGKGKWILREMLKRRLGPPVANKRKQGFTVPLAFWLRNELRELVGDLLSPSMLARTGLFQAAEVGRLWDDHQRGRANNYKKLWTLTVAQSWMLANTVK